MGMNKVMCSTGELFSKCEVTDRKGVLITLRKWYSFERSHSILQIVSEDDFYEETYSDSQKLH